jgi:hypothetical protein
LREGVKGERRITTAGGKKKARARVVGRVPRLVSLALCPNPSPAVVARPSRVRDSRV